MKKLVIGMVVVVSLGLLFFVAPKGKSDAFTIGIVVPVQNVALDDIVNGFKNELATIMPNRVIDVQVQNAIGDINLQKSAFNKFINDKVDMLVPIGKSATLMALNLAPKSQQVLFLAAFIPPQSEIAVQNPSVLGVIDEIPVETQIKFMRAAMPNLNKIAVVYVSNDKVFDDVKEFSEKAAHVGIVVQKLMVQNLSELYTMTSRIESDSQAIFTLKDVMVTSGINALVQQANNLKIPLITSDEGTVKSGAAFAVGVVEADIGRQGARIAAHHIEKSDVSHIQYLDKISVFMNVASCRAQGVDIDALNAAATSMKLSVIEG